MKDEGFVVQIWFLVALTSESSLRKLRHTFIGKECGFYIPASQKKKKISLNQLEYYLALSKTSENSERFIFRGLSRGKKFSLRTKQTSK